MQLDLNLLVALDVLLEEGSVGGAADRLGLSAPAMSRTLGRIRRATGDPILVRSGRCMVPTPRALALRAEVHTLVERAQALLRPDQELDLSTLDRTFSLQCHDAFGAGVGARLLAALRAEAHGVRLRLLPEAATDTNDLRQGSVDLAVGTVHSAPPEISVELLARDRMIGVVRADHPLASGAVTAERFARAEHLSISRRGRGTGPIDEALAAQGLSREVTATAASVTAGLLLVRESGLVGVVADRLCRTAVRALGLHTFELPVTVPPLLIHQSWHHRYDADAAHAWLRDHVREAVQGA
ncbi:LysR family transcriptional regulator [Kutzneria albida]|uniref:HTH lysR-type domain-containing protein n=1 Tax=Kutzneria albida DSM 43870 TaxID=1449976 RepID=W5WFK3_9PSEU|nr:LysR family transcriptional regulator [Kutzneria albida]AHH99530.1 hypothetical protein KALB_6170 [Kutzneria albida DSM 43870]